MSTSYYRIQSADRDTADLLDEANWESRTYYTETWIIDSETGEEIEDVRHGISTCSSLEGLAEYLAQTGIEIAAHSVIVELEAAEADDEDHDAGIGAILVWPTAIVSVTPASDEFFDMVNAAYDRIYS